MMIKKYRRPKYGRPYDPEAIHPWFVSELKRYPPGSKINHEKEELNQTVALVEDTNPWTQKQKDVMFDLWLAENLSIKLILCAIKRSKDGFTTMRRKLITKHPEVKEYMPGKRVNRTGSPITPRDRYVVNLIYKISEVAKEYHADDPEHVANILARDIKETKRIIKGMGFKC